METELTSSAELRRENDELRDELSKIRAEKEFVWSLWKKLQVTSPDVGQAVSLVVQREKEKAEAKDQKVLQILHAKDAKLAELESQNLRLSVELSGLMKQKSDLLERVERLDAEVVSLHDKNRHLMAQLKATERGNQSQDTLARDSVARCEAEAARLRAQVGQLQAESADMRDQAANARLAARAAQEDCRAARAEAAADRERRAHLEGQAALLQQVQALQEGTQAMLEAQSDELTGLRAELQRWRDACAQLEARQATVQAASTAAGRGPPDSSAPVPDLPYKIAQLEAKVATLKARARRPHPASSTPVPQAIVELQGRLNAATKRIVAAEAEARVKDAEAGRLRADLQKKATRVATLKSALRLAKEEVEDRLNAERLLADNAKLQNEMALMQVQLAEHSATEQQLRQSLEFERRANAELRDAVTAQPRAEDVRTLTTELEGARRKVLQLRDLIARQSRELETHAAGRREADSRAEAARAELTRKNQVLVEMKRYLRHLGRRVTGLRAGGVGQRASMKATALVPPTTDEDLDDAGWEDLEEELLGAGDNDALADDPDSRNQPASGRSLGRVIAASATSLTAGATLAVGHELRPLFMARLQARAGALQQQLLQCRRARQKAAGEREQAREAAARLRSELAQCQARCRRLKEACDKAQRQHQQSTKDPGYHSEGPTADEYLGDDVDFATGDDARRAGPLVAELSDQLARCRQAKSRVERELRASRDTLDEVRKRLRAAEEAAATERAASERAKEKSATLKETVRRHQPQLETARAAAASASEQRRRFEQLWQEARAELEAAKLRTRQAAADGERRRRQADEAAARAQGVAETARDQLTKCQSRLALAERLLGQLGRQLEAKVDAARMLLAAHCDRVNSEPLPQPIAPTNAAAAAAAAAATPDSDHLRRARDRAAGILNLSRGELDALLAVDADHGGVCRPAASTDLQRRRLGELRGALGSREADKQWANQCLRLAQAALASNSTSEADQLLDKFSEKFDEILNAIRLLVC